MKYQLETIPVWDAYRAGSECPLCLLQRKAEAGYVSFFLGSSVMAPEMRVQVNDVGFCPPHYTMLMAGGNRLGLALITSTHIGELRRKLDRQLRPGKSGGALKKEIAGLGAFLREHLQRCMICDRLGQRFMRYAFTIVYLWQTEKEFRDAFIESKGFCLDHIGGTLDMAVDTLDATQLNSFVTELLEVQQQSWNRLTAELLAFTGKFDHQADTDVTITTKQSVADAIQKLTGGDVTRE